MPKNSYLDQRNRHEALLGLLKSRELWTTGELCQALRVSHRTLMRDLHEFKTSGLPIESDRGPGGGIRLHQNWGLGKLQLTYSEIIDLLVAMAAMEKMPSTLLMKNLRNVRLKIARSFPESQRRLIESLRQRIWVGAKASDEVLSNLKPPGAGILDHIQRGFFESKQLKIEYADEKNQKTERLIEPHYLIFSWPVWYIFAWDHLRSDTRFFRTDRVISCELAPTGFKMHNKQAFMKQLEEFFESI
jgi:predicted DNA-binding transcriptional regulator YafY